MKIQDVICLINSLVVCQTSYQKRGVSLATDLKWLNAITGWEMTHEEFLRNSYRGIIPYGDGTRKAFLLRRNFWSYNSLDLLQFAGSETQLI